MSAIQSFSLCTTCLTHSTSFSSLCETLSGLLCSLFFSSSVLMSVTAFSSSSSSFSSVCEGCMCWSFGLTKWLWWRVNRRPRISKIPASCDNSWSLPGMKERLLKMFEMQRHLPCSSSREGERDQRGRYSFLYTSLSSINNVGDFGDSAGDLWTGLAILSEPLFAGTRSLFFGSLSALLVPPLSVFWSPSSSLRICSLIWMSSKKLFSRRLGLLPSLPNRCSGIWLIRASLRSKSETGVWSIRCNLDLLSNSFLSFSGIIAGPSSATGKNISLSVDGICMCDRSSLSPSFSRLKLNTLATGIVFPPDNLAPCLSVSPWSLPLLVSALEFSMS